MFVYLDWFWIWHIAIEYSLCQIWSVYMQYLRCRDHSNKCVFLIIHLTEVLLNFLVGGTTITAVIWSVTCQNVDKPKRRQPKRRQAETPTNRNVDEPKRWQTETSTNQNVDRPKRRQTKTSTDQNVDKPKRRQTKTSTNQNVGGPKYRHSIAVNCLQNLWDVFHPYIIYNWWDVLYTSVPIIS